MDQDLPLLVEEYGGQVLSDEEYAACEWYTGNQESSIVDNASQLPQQHTVCYLLAKGALLHDPCGQGSVGQNLIDQAPVQLPGILE